MESYTTSKPSTNTSTAYDTPSIKIETPEYNRYRLSLYKLLEFLLDLDSMYQ